mmetsp:Transcript_4503/g.12289  ORF Transcript_4503/g.12289 Transcript_4503/m.12289 type:complete len:316 (+) Transcript_4503:1361-2308(+)
MVCRSAFTLSHSESTRLDRLRMNSKYDRPPICSLIQPARPICAFRRFMAKEWPPEMTIVSRPALVSSTICLKRAWSSRRAPSSTSRTRPTRSPDLSAMALPRTMILARGSSGLLRMGDVKGNTLKPPVLRPMVSTSSTKLSFSVAMLVRERQNSGTRGSSDSGTDFISITASMYTTLLVNRSCVRMVAPWRLLTSVGTLVTVLGMSDSFSAGTQLSASGASGVSWRRFSSCVLATTSSTSLGCIDFILASSLAFSSPSTFAPRVGSGSSTTVTLCLLSSRYLRIKGPNTSSPLARRALKEASASSHCRGTRGSRS